MSGIEVHLRLSESDAATLDAIRGALGRPAALRRLIRSHRTGDTSPASYTEALAMLTAQAEQGSTPATIALARLLQADERAKQAEPERHAGPFGLLVEKHNDELAARRRALGE